ncbi:hypothetical protein DXG01_003805 [Tephrocybe rancida]|nr:hypothetical protein DXG01_003805 [Tephrocybe rancida]
MARRKGRRRGSATQYDSLPTHYQGHFAPTTPSLMDDRSWFCLRLVTSCDIPVEFATVFRAPTSAFAGSHATRIHTWTYHAPIQLAGTYQHLPEKNTVETAGANVTVVGVGVPTAYPPSSRAHSSPFALPASSRTPAGTCIMDGHPFPNCRLAISPTAAHPHEPTAA